MRKSHFFFVSNLYNSCNPNVSNGTIPQQIDGISPSLVTPRISPKAGKSSAAAIVPSKTKTNSAEMIFNRRFAEKIERSLAYSVRSMSWQSVNEMKQIDMNSVAFNV